MDERTITLILTAPDSGETKITCDSVRFTVPDGERNRNTGGSVGIRPGHTEYRIYLRLLSCASSLSFARTAFS